MSRVFIANDITLTDDEINKKILEDFKCYDILCQLIFQDGALIEICAPYGYKLAYKLFDKNGTFVSNNPNYDTIEGTLEYFRHKKCLFKFDKENLYISLLLNNKRIYKLQIYIELVDTTYKLINDEQDSGIQEFFDNGCTVLFYDIEDNYALCLFPLSNMNFKNFEILCNKNLLSGQVKLRKKYELNQRAQAKNPPKILEITNNILTCYSKNREVILIVEAYIEHSLLLTKLTGEFRTTKDVEEEEKNEEQRKLTRIREYTERQVKMAQEASLQKSSKKWYNSFRKK